MNSIVRNSGAFYAYCFAYLILEQKYVCKPIDGDDFTQCSVEDICQAREAGEDSLSFVYKVDKDYEYYLNNWYVEMDMMCTPITKISLMFTVYFIGNIVGGVFAVIPDRIGRKRSVIGGMGVSIMAQLTMIFFPSILIRSISFFVMGLANLKNSQSYVWASESVSFQHRANAFTIINVVDALPTLITGLFYLLVSPDWFPIYTINLAVSFIAFFLAFLCPESPRWLLYNGR